MHFKFRKGDDFFDGFSVDAVHEVGKRLIVDGAHAESETRQAQNCALCLVIAHFLESVDIFFREVYGVIELFTGGKHQKFRAF